MGMNHDPGLIRLQEVGVLPGWYPPEWIATPRTKLTKNGKNQKHMLALGEEIAGAFSTTMHKKASKVAWTDFDKEAVANEEATMQAASDQIYQALLEKRERRTASKKAKASTADRGVKCSWRWREM